MGSFASMTFYWAAQAEADLAAGNLDGARAAIADAMRYIERSDERVHESALRDLAARIERAAT
jgi:hypothetical protein